MYLLSSDKRCKREVKDRKCYKREFLSCKVTSQGTKIFSAAHGSVLDGIFAA